MPLDESKREEIRQAVAAGKTPNRQASGRVTLPLTGKRYAVLSTGGKETAQGAFYKTLVGEGQGLGGLGEDRVVRPNSGNREFLQTRGKKTLLRSIDPANGQWVYTRAGQKYCSAHEFHEYVVYIPVEIESWTAASRAANGQTGCHGASSARTSCRASWAPRPSEGPRWFGMSRRASGSRARET